MDLFLCTVVVHVAWLDSLTVVGLYRSFLILDIAAPQAQHELPIRTAAPMLETATAVNAMAAIAASAINPIFFIILLLLWNYGGTVPAPPGR